ncbi:MAG TPA: hypothetical protein VOA80_20990 [Thermoanaerobaculia bacterium]|nr:hypothetical protein [Thermoanaerobaculia bacterium]
MNVYSMLVILGVYSLFAWVILTLLANRRLTNAARIQAELQTRLLDKLGTSQELLAYLESPAGQRLALAVTLERGNPYRRILGSVQTGLILTVVGGALLALRGQLGAEDVHGLTFVGAIGMSLGIAFLASAYMAYRLSKAWGLLGTPGECAGATDRA